MDHDRTDLMYIYISVWNVVNYKKKKRNLNRRRRTCVP